MSRGPSKFRQGDVTKAVKAVARAGFEVARIELGNDGRIIIIAGKPGMLTVPAETPEDVRKLL